MTGLEVVVVVLTAVLALTWAARRLRVSEPVLLLVGGGLIGLAPAFDSFRLTADVVLLIFLPPLLYAESLNISLQQIRENLRVIVLLSVGLVLTTAVTVAATAHGFGLTWPMAFVLGAVLAPTDATAVASVAKGMPRRALTTMKAESLINDGTALVVFALAVDLAVGRHGFEWADTVGRFALSYAGGIAIGAAGALLVVLVRKGLRDTAVESGLSVLTPFAVYLPAELAGVSGVLAVVVCGLILSRASPLLMRAGTRIRVLAFWNVTTFLLNASLFVLVGIQLPGVVRDLTSLGLREAAKLAGVVSVVVILTRMVFIHTTPYVIRVLDRRPQQRARRIGFRQRMPGAWGGVRGAVSLAAALAVPTVTHKGARLPDHDVIVFVTAVVIVVTLLLQGQTLPAVIRWSKLPADPAEDEEELLARREVVSRALDALPDHAARLGAPDLVADRLAQELHDHAESLTTSNRPLQEAEHSLRKALLVAKRNALVDMRDAHRIDDAVLRRVQETLDSEEVRLELRATAPLPDAADDGPDDGEGDDPSDRDGGDDEDELGPDRG
ncbi:Na+/H+ antiporter [Streptomyces sp. 150FB]|uniref:Na+/H+ antiporter n=1 Tax=Streptomyces sp. 150FB TaxID=1576605 RepID=UPI0007C78BF3|nr:Na+/H+ antiporter [Streptomyces sp. 150FB]